MKQKSLHKEYDKVTMKTLNCDVEWDLKSIKKDAKGLMIIEGFANTSDKDRVGDVVLPSAFAKSLPEYMENPILLYQHDWDKLIGNVIESKIIDNDDEGRKGLWVKAAVSNAKDVNDVRTKIQEGSLKTFSIGYNEIDSDWDKETSTNIIQDLELLEISIVTVPANPFAKFSTSEEDENKSSQTIVNKELLDFISEAVNSLKSGEKVDSDFLKDIIEVYNESAKTGE